MSVRSHRLVLPAALLLLSAPAELAPRAVAANPGVTCPPPAASGAAPAPAPASGDPAPQETIACVGTLALAGSAYVHWLHVAERSAGGAGAHASPAELRAEVLGFLISSDWVLEEGARLHVVVSAAQVKRTFDHIRAQQFHRRREFNAFLRSSGQTVPDLLLRVKLNILSSRIQRAVVLAGGRGAAAQQRALTRFVKEFKARWSAATVCEPQFAVPDCGRLQAAPL